MSVHFIPGKSIRQWIYSLPEPHKSNLWHSLTPVIKRNNFVMPSVLSVLCLINWKNGFAPESYYENLFNHLSNESKRHQTNKK